MERETIHQVMEMLSLQHIADRNEFVNSTCPFAKWKHEEGVSTRNSFGIKVGNDSFYHCFSCGMKGKPMLLPFILEQLSKQDYSPLRKLLFSGGASSVKYKNDVFILPKEMVEIKVEGLFKPLDFNYRNLAKQTIKEFDLSFDPKEKRIIIPIRDFKNRLVAIKGRAIDKSSSLRYRLYNEFGDDPKRYGVWFNCHKSLTPSKFLFLVEGEMDAILLKQEGIHNVWACMGAGITKRQIDTLKKVTNLICLFLDNDKAGMIVRDKIIKSFKGKNLYMVTNYYGYKDCGEACFKKDIKKLLNSVKEVVKNMSA